MAKKIEMTDLAPVPVSPSRRDDVMQMLGAARYVEWLHNQTASHLMQFLMNVENEKLYLDAGYGTFTEFLDSSGLKSKSAFYRQRDLYLKEGAEQHDLFEEWKIPQSTRRLLEAGDIQIVDDEVVIAGTERVSLTNSGSIKAILEQLVKEKIAATKTAAESTERLERTERRLKAEQSTVDDLRAAIDKFNEKTPFQIAFGDLLAAASILADFVANELDDEDRERRAEEDCKTLDIILDDVRAAYGIAKWQTMLREADAKVAAAGGANK